MKNYNCKHCGSEKYDTTTVRKINNVTIADCAWCGYDQEIKDTNNRTEGNSR